LNSEDWYKERYPEWRARAQDMDDKEYHKWEFDPKAVDVLNKIIEQTQADIVVSSTWRSMPSIKEILAYAGVKGNVVGITPRLWWNDIEANMPFNDRAPSLPRGLEIEAYLYHTHPEYSVREQVRYVILDDDSDMLYRQKDKFIHTSWWHGLTTEHIEIAVNILNKEN